MLADLMERWECGQTSAIERAIELAHTGPGLVEEQPDLRNPDMRFSTKGFTESTRELETVPIEEF